MSIERSSAQGGPNIITDSLILYLDAANNRSYVSGSTIWNDLTEYKNDGSLINGPTFSIIKAGSIVFDGVDDIINPSNSKWISSPSINELTLSSTVKALGTSFFKYIVHHASGNGEFGLVTGPHALVTSDKYGGFVKLSDNQFYPVDGLPCILGEWANLTLVYRKGIDLKFYQNGNLISTLSLPNLDLSTFFPSIVTRISGYGGGGFNFQGEISTIKLYSRALSDSEILQNYNALKYRYL